MTIIPTRHHADANDVDDADDDDDDYYYYYDYYPNLSQFTTLRQSNMAVEARSLFQMRKPWILSPDLG